MSQRNFPIGRQVQVGGRFTAPDQQSGWIYKYAGFKRGKGRASQGVTFRSSVTSAVLRLTTGTQDITIPGFGTPKAAIVIGVPSSTEGGTGPHITYSLGVTDGANQWCIAGDAQDNVGVTNTHSVGRTDEIVIQGNVAGATAIEANFVSFIDNGIRINVGKTDGSSKRIIVILIGGTAVTAAAGTLALGGLGAPTVTATPGLQMNALILSDLHAAFGPSINDICFKNNGFASYDGSTLLQCCCNNDNLDNSADGQPRIVVDDDKILVNGAASWTVSLSNITDTEFDLTSNGADLSTHEVGYLALNIGSHKAWAGIVDSPIVTGDHEFTEPAFLPFLGLMIPTLATAVDTAIATAAAGAMGLTAFDGSDDWCVNWTDEDAAATSNTSTASSNKAIDLNTDAQAAAFDATFVEWLATGAKLNFTAVPGTARKWPALFLGL